MTSQKGGTGAKEKKAKGRRETKNLDDKKVIKTSITDRNGNWLRVE